MWTCPACGRSFVTANAWHSCIVIDEEEHLAKSTETVRATYQAIREAVTELGGRVEPVKGYIEFAAKTRFATATPRQKWLLLHIGSDRVLEHPLRNHVEGPIGGVWISRFRLESPDDFDHVLRGYLEEAYHAFGLRERLD